MHANKDQEDVIRTVTVNFMKEDDAYPMLKKEKKEKVMERQAKRVFLFPFHTHPLPFLQ